MKPVYLPILVSIILFSCSKSEQNTSKTPPTLEEARAVAQKRARDGDYRTLTRAEISSWDDLDLEFDVWEAIMFAVADSVHSYDRAEPLLTEGQRALWITVDMGIELFDGFKYYYYIYYDSQPKLIRDAEWAFRTIGANDYADVIKKANEVYEINKNDLARNEDGSLKDPTKYNQTNPFDSLDGKWNELGLSKLTELQVKYIREHLDEFSREFDDVYERP